MIQELILTPSTVVLVVIIVALAALAIRRLVNRGMCDCSDHCGSDCCSKKTKDGSCESCTACSASQKMIEDMQNRVNS